MQVVLEELTNPQFRISEYGRALQDRQGALVIDAKSVFDNVTREGNKLPQDKRLAIDLRLLSFYLENSSFAVKWVAGPQQLVCRRGTR